MGKTKINIYRLSDFPIQDKRIEDGLRDIGLIGMLATYKDIAKRTLKEKRTFHDFLESLLEKELGLREDNRLRTWIKRAGFPWQRTIAEFDFSWPKSIDEELIRELVSCRFIEESENVAFFGTSGVGKTHLAVGLGQEAILNGHEVKFFTLGRLIEQIEKAEERGKVNLLLSSLLRIPLLILDEMDLYEVNETVSNFLFKLLYDRDELRIQKKEKRSVIFTSNQDFEAWGKLFGSASRASAILDRINHKLSRVDIEGDSYRVKDKLPKKFPNF